MTSEGLTIAVPRGNLFEDTLDLQAVHAAIAEEERQG